MFQSYYCRLCYCLWHFGGQLVRFFTTFDLTLYSMILHLALEKEAPPFLPCQRILTSNRKRFAEDEIGLRLAKLSLVTFGEKFRDDMIDEGGFKNFLKKLLFQRVVNRAGNEEPLLAKIAFEGTEAINRLQEEQAGVDALLSSYGDSVDATFRALGVTEERYLRLFRALGKWTYFVDILCDFDEDCRKGQYNPLKSEGIDTLDKYLSVNYASLLEKNREIGHEVYDALLAIRADRPEWEVSHKIILHSLNTVVPRILKGEDVTFHYFKELLRNRRLLAEERRIIKKKRKHEQR